MGPINGIIRLENMSSSPPAVASFGKDENCPAGVLAYVAAGARPLLGLTKGIPIGPGTRVTTSARVASVTVPGTPLSVRSIPSVLVTGVAVGEASATEAGTAIAAAPISPAATAFTRARGLPREAAPPE
jgi:hypothetical protein